MPLIMSAAVSLVGSVVITSVVVPAVGGAVDGGIEGEVPLLLAPLVAEDEIGVVVVIVTKVSQNSPGISITS